MFDSCFHRVPHFSLRKHHISGRVKQIEVSDNHFFALTHEGELYGWGLVDMLGVGTLTDTRDYVVMDVINPMGVMSKVEHISTSQSHAVVVKRDGSIFGWGNAAHFSNQQKGQFLKPTDLSE